MSSTNIRTPTSCRRRGRRLALAVALAVAVTMAAGCGSGTSSSSGATGSGGSVYVASQRAGEVDRYDARLQRTATWTIGGDPHILAWDSAHSLLWVSAPKTGTLRALDPSTGQVVATLTIAEPDGMAFVPGTGTLLVTSGISGPGRLAFVDTAARTVTAQVPVGSAPHAIAVSADGSRAYVTDQYSNDVAVVDVAARRMVSSIPLDGTPYFLALRGGSLYVSRTGNGRVSVVDVATSTVTREFQLPTGISQLAVSDDGRKLYVAVRGLAFFSGFPNGNVGASVSVIDLTTAASLDITVPTGPDAVLLDGDTLLTTGLGQGTVSRIDLASGMVSTQPAGTFPTSVAVGGA